MHISQQFDAELISNKLVDGVALVKAAGIDKLSSENLIFSNPILMCLLTCLFNYFIYVGRTSYGFSNTSNTLMR